MSADISKSPAQQASTPRPRRGALIALCVAALANFLVPAVLFSETRLFGQVEPGDRALVALVVLIEYAIVFLLLFLHANVGFASGYAVATAAVVVTLTSAVVAFITMDTASWSRSALFAETLVVGGFAFGVLSNTVFLVASIRYARAIHPRLHLGGFLLDIAASLALVFLYIHILP